MKIGNINISNLKLGIVQIKKVFIGLDLIWTSFLSIINDFKTRVLSNQGQFEGETCLNDGLEEIGIDLFDKASLVVTPNGTKVSKLYSIKPSDGSGDLTVTRATTATRVNSSGLIESVGANIARLDYTNGTCPSLLVEPQRSNLFLRSDDFTNGWTLEGTSVIGNTQSSPSGNLTADVLSELGTNDVHRTYRSAIATTANAKYTTSFFVKKNNVRYVRLILTQSGSSTIWAGAQFDLDTQSFTSKVGTGGGTFVNATITPFSNGWYRISVTGSIISTAMIPVLALSNGSAMLNTDTRGCPVYLGNTSNSLYVWGAQLELGINVTSYIPTTSTTTTRNQDVINKGSISSLIGQTEGVFYTELQFFEGGNRFNGIELYSNTNNRIFIYKNFNDDVTFGFYSNGVGTTIASYASGYNMFKVAIKYKSGNSSVYINGNLIATSNNAISFTQIDRINFNVNQNSNSYSFHGLLSQIMLFNTLLSDTELQNLTTL